MIEPDENPLDNHVSPTSMVYQVSIETLDPVGSNPLVDDSGLVDSCSFML